MRVDSAVQLINSLVYKPGWTFMANSHTNRFEGTVKVLVTYPALNSDREDAPDYNSPIEPDGARASFPIIVSDLDDTGIYRAILDIIVKIETHEAREFLRVEPTMWAPFHPHRIEGMKRFGDVDGDLAFGLC